MFGLNYDNAKSRPDGERWFRRGQRDPEPRPTDCFDCARRVYRGAVSVPVCGGRTFCAECGRWRSAHLLLFDERTKRELQREVA